MYNRWVLRILRGKERHSLKFTERDVAAWPRYPAVPEKYEAGIRNLVESLRPAQ